jgi:hypothetical protein
MRFEEGLPGHRPSPQGGGLDAVLLENALYGGASEIESEVVEVWWRKNAWRRRRLFRRGRDADYRPVVVADWPSRPAARGRVMHPSPDFDPEGCRSRSCGPGAARASTQRF